MYTGTYSFVPSLTPEEMQRLEVKRVPQNSGETIEMQVRLRHRPVGCQCKVGWGGLSLQRSGVGWGGMGWGTNGRLEWGGGKGCHCSGVGRGGANVIVVGCSAVKVLQYLYSFAAATALPETTRCSASPFLCLSVPQQCPDSRFEHHFELLCHAQQTHLHNIFGAVHQTATHIATCKVISSHLALLPFGSSIAFFIGSPAYLVRAEQHHSVLTIIITLCCRGALGDGL